MRTDVAWFQMMACNTDLWICWYRAAWVGGKASSVFFPLVKSRSLLSLTLDRPQPLLYITTTNRSRVCMCSDCRLSCCGSLLRATSVLVSPVVLCQADQAVFLTHPRMCETVSQPVTAWNSDREMHLDGPNWAARINGNVTNLFSVPRHTHSSYRPSDANRWMARMTTSLSTVRTKAIWWPWLAAWARWSSILVSPSASLHGWRPEMSCC